LSNVELKELLKTRLREEKIWGSVEIIRKIGKMNNIWALRTLLDSGALVDTFPANRKETKQAILSCINNLDNENERDASILLVELLENRDKEIRYASSETLKTFSEPLSMDIVKRMLSDTDWRIRENAVDRLTKQPLDQTIDLLISSCEDNHSSVRQSAVLGMGNVLVEASDQREYTAIFKAIINCLEDYDGNVRAEAAYCLGKNGDREALEPLKKALVDEDHEWAEAEIIGAIEDIENRKKR